MFDLKNSFVMNRRDVLRLLGGGMGAAMLGSLPETVLAQRQRDTLVIGIDISDIVTLDPARIATNRERPQRVVHRARYHDRRRHHLIERGVGRIAAAVE